MKRVLIGLVTIHLISAPFLRAQTEGSNASSPQVEFALQKVAFQIGATKIHAQVRQFGTNSLSMVNLHDDEQTSVDAAVAILEKRGGRLVELTHTGKRRVVFELEGKEYSFDPNRIFSKAGVRLTVRREDAENVKIPDVASAAVDRFASQFIQFFGLDKQPAIIALHNNGEDGLSIHSYKPGAEYEADTDEFHVHPEADPDDFYYVTDKRYFDAMKQRGFNVILQDNSIRRNDGSFSVFAGRHGIPYINVEAQHGHFDEQVRMIDVAIDIILSAPGNTSKQ